MHVLVARGCVIGRSKGCVKGRSRGCVAYVLVASGCLLVDREDVLRTCGGLEIQGFGPGRSARRREKLNHLKVLTPHYVRM